MEKQVRIIGRHAEIIGRIMSTKEYNWQNFYHNWSKPS